MHAYDDRLPDFSETGVGDTLADAEDLLRCLYALPEEALGESQRLDRQLAEGFLRIQRWESSSAHFGPRANPTLFTGEAIFGLVSLLLRPFAPLDDRLHSAAARLAAIPEFLDNAARHAQPAPPAWRERARRECSGQPTRVMEWNKTCTRRRDFKCASRNCRHPAAAAETADAGPYGAGKEGLRHKGSLNAARRSAAPRSQQI